jgi:hypothetical protein
MPVYFLQNKTFKPVAAIPVQAARLLGIQYVNERRLGGKFAYTKILIINK